MKNTIQIAIMVIAFATLAASSVSAQRLDLSERQAIYTTGQKTDKIDLTHDKYVGAGKVLALSQNVATKCDADGGCWFNLGVSVWRSLNGKPLTAGVLSTYGSFSLPDYTSAGNTIIFHDGESIAPFVQLLKLKPGDNKVTFTIDPYKKTPEADENNNSVSVTIRVVRVSREKPTLTKP
jgi:hypothetical protein